ncbi:2-hydroxyacid dehydrogenase [Kibdelosporangium phytohabitans]|uniref:Phosphoglycerate dehydrogenase n=1 Tax=Kibdelosporangium phytohabitans TaxID=860235 RepID=A0A0N9I9U2_9PSEU|nr:2-hydroxyacid dehydrogenase [Kibdelosporangium phytohabitans]ALG13138.1 phosphoglycerate dehydrogenase [Kibdelosporangium phytohabitans]MBE1464885.1 phosphoglycerate dehydrogenase-like enzyme [Kibdelosporangium phytohabitans]
MPITVLVPDDHGMSALAELDGVTPLRFELGEPLPPGAADAEVIVPGMQAGRLAVDYLPHLPKLKLVQLLSAGVENWIGQLPDGIMLANCRGAHGGSTAEWAMTALLTIYREMREFDAAQRERRWDFHKTDSLQGKRVLTIGAGDLGNQLKRRLEAFDAHVTMVGTTAREGVRGIGELPGLLGDHDAVVLMVPVTPQTVGMVDAKFLSLMVDGAVLVNAARGPVVVTDDLLAELRQGRLRAALDVTDPEPLPSDHPLWTAPGLLLTPHVAGTCTRNMERAYAVAASQIAMFAAGEKPSNLVRGEY